VTTSAPVHSHLNGPVLVVTLDRPERRNAVDEAVVRALIDVHERVRAEQIGAVVLTGAPPAFCAGADLTGIEGPAFAALLGRALRGFGEAGCVTIAAVDGAALGAGTQLALACDLRVVTQRARFGIPAAKLGLMVDRWTVDRLVAHVGAPTARMMLLTAAEVSASRALELGLAQRSGTLDDAVAWATEIATTLAPLSIAGHKQALEGCSTSAYDAAFARAWASDDAFEGPLAFREKRPPRFTGA
jgi:enoyl-CoA hydratase